MYKVFAPIDNSTDLGSDTKQMISSVPRLFLRSLGFNPLRHCLLCYLFNQFFGSSA